MNANERENFQSVLLYFQFIYLTSVYTLSFAKNYASFNITALITSAQEVRPALYCNSSRMFC
jgi:hypothetical protein